MIGLKKKELKLFSKRKKVTFKRFFAWDCGDETALVASESLNCNCGDGFIKTGLGMSTYYNANGGTVSFPSSSLKLQ